jgi:hypothetical protein
MATDDGEDLCPEVFLTDVIENGAGYVPCVAGGAIAAVFAVVLTLVLT